MICRRERERERKRKRKKRVVQQKKEKAFHDVFDVCLRVRVRCESVCGCGELVSPPPPPPLPLPLSLFFLLFSAEWTMYSYVRAGARAREHDLRWGSWERAMRTTTRRKHTQKTVKGKGGEEKAERTATKTADRG